MKDLRLNAYVLLAEPEWLEVSVRSYYPMVRRIVASFDRHDRGWTGAPIRAAECVERLKAIDDEGKVEFLPGDYGALIDPMANDTRQRQEALVTAGHDADWVLQIDTDEVLPTTSPFLAALVRASAGEWGVVRYPNRVIRQHLRDNAYLEECNRVWLTRGGTLPIAVRPGTVLTEARESRASAFRVGFPRQRVTARPGRRPRMTVALRDALVHLSWVRDPDGLRHKFSSWGHSHDRDWPPIFDRWEWAGRHPGLAVALTPFSRVPFVGQLRRVTLNGVPAPPWAGPA